MLDKRGLNMQKLKWKVKIPLLAWRMIIVLMKMLHPIH